MRYPYLNDKPFLKMFDNEKHKIQYVRISVLDFETENIIADIEGKSTGGNCTLNGDSNMRRAASCSLLVDPDGIKMPGFEGEWVQYYDITEVQNLISMNKKVKIETGFNNNLANLGYYPSCDKIWFPLGTYVITAANVSRSNSGMNISLTLKDKCALLNGDMGGTIPAGTIFSEMEAFEGSDKTQSYIQKILLKDIIKSLVIEFGGERPENVIVTDIPDSIVNVIKWNGKEKLYLNITSGQKRFSTIKPDDDDMDNWIEFHYGQNIGYMNEPFVYPGVLECNPGESVSSVLDKIKNVLGNFEWFYDLDGRFIFQQIRNSLNKNTASDFRDMREDDYLSYSNQTETAYVFDNKNLIASIANNPQYQNIKNDYFVWGTAKTPTGADKPIRYHLAFDGKPKADPSKKRTAILTKDHKGFWKPTFLELGINYEEGSPAEIIKQKIGYPLGEYELGSFVKINKLDKNKFYVNITDTTVEIWGWDKEKQTFLVQPEYELCYLTTADWRTELYYLGLETDNKTFSKNPYSAELNAEWPKIKNIKGKTLTNSKYEWKPWGTYVKYEPMVSENGVKGTVIESSGQGSWPRIRFTTSLNNHQIITPMQGKEYTLTFEYKMSRRDNNKNFTFGMGNSDGHVSIFSSVDVHTGINTALEWKKVQYDFNDSFERNEPCEDPEVALYFYCGSSGAAINGANIGDWSEIRNIRLIDKSTGLDVFDFSCIPNYKDDYYFDLDVADYEYWLDFLEGDEGGNDSISKFSIKNIGRRTKVVVDDNSNCIFPVQIPNYTILEADGDVYQEILEATSKGQEVIQVAPEMFKDFSLGGSQNSAYEKIKDLIFTHTQYNETINLSIIPIYYLEPNTLISVFDRETGVNGEYLIKTISLPLTPNGTSNISATKSLAKTI